MTVMTLIIRIGAMESATACHAGQRSKKVLGSDRFAPLHTMVSIENC